MPSGIFARRSFPVKLLRSDASLASSGAAKTWMPPSGSLPGSPFPVIEFCATKVVVAPDDDEAAEGVVGDPVVRDDVVVRPEVEDDALSSIPDDRAPVDHVPSAVIGDHDAVGAARRNRVSLDHVVVAPAAS